MGKILSCYNKGSVSSSANDCFGVGGIAGCFVNGNISKCSNVGNVGDNNTVGSVGGIAGYTEYNVLVNNCYNEGIISCDNPNYLNYYTYGYVFKGTVKKSEFPEEIGYITSFVSNSS